MNIKCTCGSENLKALKFGGDLFRVQNKNKLNLLRFSGFKPDVWVCNNCKQILFSMNDSDYEKLG